MQNKGIIRFFAVAFALVCIYSLSFTYCTKRVEKEAKEFAHNSQVISEAKQAAGGDLFKQKMVEDSVVSARESWYLDSMSNEVIYNLLVAKYTYKDCKNKEVNFGLDLKGGMNVVLEVSMSDILKTMAGKKASDPAFVEAIKRADQKQKTTQTDYITLFEASMKEVDPNAQLASFFSYELEKVETNSTNDEVIKVIREESEGAVDRTYQILRTRIDRFGVVQPNIQKLSQSNRILLELPGIKEPERVRKLLQGSANLEFWKTYENREVYEYLVKADERLANINTGDTVATDSADVEATVADSTEVAKNDASKLHPLFTLLQPSVSQNGELLAGPVVGLCLAKDMTTVEEMLEKVKNIFPRDLRLYWSAKSYDDKGMVYQLIALKGAGEKGAVLTGEAISDARYDVSQQGGNEISMQMTSAGAKTWKKVTGDNIGKSIAIVLDKSVYSYPTVQNEIPNGRSSITGHFTIEEAKDLANLLKAGKLPASARIVQEEVVGPTLGQEAVDSGLLSFIIAFVLVLLYMFFYYNKSGLVANIALLFNVLLIFGVLASLGAVLTLPGIAGIVLTLGMAVDANVIISERVREELRAGKGLRSAIEDGYKNAYSAIIDGNVTTIITGIILYVFGTGPIQGFATTLVIGILSSMFTAIFITRLVFERMLNEGMDISFSNKMTANVLTNTHFDFIGKRRIAHIITLSIIAIGIISFAVRGLTFGIDFTGGRTYTIRFDQNVNTEELKSSFTSEFGEAPEIKAFGSGNQIKLTTKYLINDKERSETEIDSIVERKLYKSMLPFYTKENQKMDFENFSVKNTDIGVMSSQKIGPSVAKDILINAIWVVLLSMLCIFLYIAIRFKHWEIALGGLASLAFVTFFVIALYSLLSGIVPFTLEADQTFIAAVLTVIGYSINDAVVIFDRLREYVGLYPKREYKDVVNASLNSTLGRTLNTSMTTIVVLLAIFIFGGASIRGFVFAIMMGVIVGTYSSIFVASPISYALVMRKKRREAAKKELKK